jgi:hypothetical protein
MFELIQRPELDFLSELYSVDAADAVLLTEYPSSNSKETRFRNDQRFIIHDPFPPPPKALLKTLGPHHLMCGWGDLIPVTSEVKPPSILLDHWQKVFGDRGVPNWMPDNDVCFESSKEDPLAAGSIVNATKRSPLITLFPHESLDAGQQLIDPEVYYHLHSKQAIAEIDCPQAAVLSEPQLPCIAKLSHGYAGLGNYLLQNESDLANMRSQLSQHWPNAKLVYNSIVPNIVGDFGVQFYLQRDGKAVWLGVTQQHFDDGSRWCGGSFSASQQQELVAPMAPFVEATAKFLHDHGYFGVVGIDVLKTQDGGHYLVDLNPRLTGISPFLMASRIFVRQHGHSAGIYQASRRFSGSLGQLIAAAEENRDATVLVLSAVEQPSEGGVETICHISASAATESSVHSVLDEFLTR